MALQIRLDRDVAILSGFGRLMNDPRYFDAAGEVRELLDRGYTKFIFELGAIGTMGASGLGLLMTLTRLIRQHKAEVVVGGIGRGMAKLLDEMQLDGHWETFDSVDEAERFLDKLAR